MTDEIEKALNEFNDIVAELRNQVSVINKEDEEDMEMTDSEEATKADAAPPRPLKIATI